MKYLALTALVTVPLSLQSSPPPLAAGQHGAAYRTAKGIFFGLRTVEVVGRTADVGAHVAWLDDDRRFRVEAVIPVSAFDSGNGRRDRHVAAPKDTLKLFVRPPRLSHCADRLLADTPVDPVAN